MTDEIEEDWRSEGVELPYTESEGMALALILLLFLLVVLGLMVARGSFDE